VGKWEGGRRAAERKGKVGNQPDPKNKQEQNRTGTAQDVSHPPHNTTKDSQKKQGEERSSKKKEINNGSTTVIHAYV